jgi:hypothetical protein
MNPQPKIHCLFHLKSDCICTVVVTTERQLKERLEHRIKLNEINNKFESDPAEKARREAEIEGWLARLENIS